MNNEIKICAFLIILLKFLFKIVEEASSYYSGIHIKYNKLAEKSVVNMKFVMYYDGIFYMRDKLFGKSFSLLTSMIKEYCSLSLNPYLPHNGEVCLGQFPGIYYF